MQILCSIALICLQLDPNCAQLCPIYAYFALRAQNALTHQLSASWAHLCLVDIFSEIFYLFCAQLRLFKLSAPEHKFCTQTRSNSIALNCTDFAFGYSYEFLRSVVHYFCQFLHKFVILHSFCTHLCSVLGHN